MGSKNSTNNKALLINIFAYITIKYIENFWQKLEKPILALALLALAGVIGGALRGVTQDAMTFVVHAPANTPADDKVYIYFQNQKSYPMRQVANFTYQAKLTPKEIEPEGEIVKYRYSRNNHDFNSAEYLANFDTNDAFWTKKGRQTTYQRGKVQRDTIARWRWFPPPDIPLANTSQLEPIGPFKERLAGRRFLSGQIIEDLYVPAFRDFFKPTANYMKKIGYNFVEIDPPEQLIEEDGFPKVKNLFKDNPNYPSEEILKEEILAFKNAGLRVALQPQLCCLALESKGRSTKWWDAYFSEINNFLARYARLAQATGVDFFIWAVDADYKGKDYAKRWEEIFKKIRENYNGEIGEMVWSGGDGTVPEKDFIKWAQFVDFFYLASDAPIYSGKNPTDKDLLEGAEKVLLKVEPLHDSFNKPVFIRTTYFNVKETWRGADFYDISSVPSTVDPEDALLGGKYRFSGSDLARVVNAYFRAIGRADWVMGYAQFGYTHWQNPLSAELSVRGKPAEDIWKKWNRLILKSIP